jgi:hypothetical protein
MKAEQKANPGKVLKVTNLSSRREFLKRAAKKCTIPAIVVYSVHKMTPPAFGRTPI